MIDAIFKRTPGPVAVRWARLIEASQRREVRRAVVILAVLVAAPSYLLMLHNLYKGDAYQYWLNSAGRLCTSRAIQRAARLPVRPGHRSVMMRSCAALARLLRHLARHPDGGALLDGPPLARSGPFSALVFVSTVSSSCSSQTRPLAAATSPYSCLAVVGLSLAIRLLVLAADEDHTAIGLLWFSCGSEWRNLAIPLGTTAVIVAVSYVFSPTCGPTAHRHPQQLNLSGARVRLSRPTAAARLVIAAAMTVVAAEFNARWVIDRGVIALPYIWSQSDPGSCTSCRSWNDK